MKFVQHDILFSLQVGILEHQTTTAVMKFYYHEHCISYTEQGRLAILRKFLEVKPTSKLPADFKV